MTATTDANGAHGVELPPPTHPKKRSGARAPGERSLAASPTTWFVWAGTAAFFIFLMVQFIRGIPLELDQAAVMDGATPRQIFWHVIIPLSLPALATTAIFTFIWTWNDFFAPLLYLTKPENFTVALGLRQFLDASGTSSFGSLFAMSVLALGPVFGFFLASQRFLVQGIATTGIK